MGNAGAAYMTPHWYQVTGNADEEYRRRGPPPARQGSDGCSLPLVMKSGSSQKVDCFCIYGGWTVGYGMSAGLAILCPRQDRHWHLEKQAEEQENQAKMKESSCCSSSSAASFPSEIEGIQQSYEWINIDQIPGRRGRPTYGHTLTLISDGGDIFSEKGEWNGKEKENEAGQNVFSACEIAMFVYGGVTMGGYRGETNRLSVIRVRSFDDFASFSGCVEGSDAITPRRFDWVDKNHPDGMQNGTARAYHSAVYVDRKCCQQDGVHPNHCGKLYIFGGFNEEGAMGELECYDLRNDEWSIPISGTEGADAPCARFGHSCSYVPSCGSLFVVGGSTGSSNYKGHTDGDELDDVWCLDLRSSGEYKPCFFISHTYTFIVIYFMSSLVPSDLGWRRIQNHLPANIVADTRCKFSPLQRCHSALVVRSGGFRHDKLLFFGGGAPGQVTNALHLFDTNSHRWEFVHLSDEGNAHCPCPRQNQSAAMMACGSKCVFFGGALARPYGREELGDAFILDLDGCQSINPQAIQECSRTTSDIHTQQTYFEDDSDDGEYGEDEIFTSSGLFALLAAQQGSQNMGFLQALMQMAAARRQNIAHSQTEEGQMEDGNENEGGEAEEEDGGEGDGDEEIEDGANP